MIPMMTGPAANSLSSDLAKWHEASRGLSARQLSFLLYTTLFHHKYGMVVEKTNNK